MGIICNSRASQNFVYDSLASGKFNIRKISDFDGSQNLSGVMVKIRKTIKDPQRVNTFKKKKNIELIFFILVYSFVLSLSMIKRENKEYTRKKDSSCRSKFANLIFLKLKKKTKKKLV